MISLTSTFGIEVWISKQPLLPAYVFRIRHIRPLLLGLLLSYGDCWRICVLRHPLVHQKNTSSPTGPAPRADCSQYSGCDWYRPGAIGRLVRTYGYGRLLSCNPGWLRHTRHI